MCSIFVTNLATFNISLNNYDFKIHSSKVAVGKLVSDGSRCDPDDKHCQIFRIADWHLHPDYKNCQPWELSTVGNSCYQYDFLLIKIQTKNHKGIQFSPLVQPISLANRELRPTKTVVMNGEMNKYFVDQVMVLDLIVHIFQ